MLTLLQPKGADYAQHIDFVSLKESRDYVPEVIKPVATNSNWYDKAERTK